MSDARPARPDRAVPLPWSALVRERRLQRRCDLGARRQRVPGGPRPSLAGDRGVTDGSAAARGADDGHPRRGRRCRRDVRREAGVVRPLQQRRGRGRRAGDAGGGARRGDVVRRAHGATPSPPVSPAAPAASPATACGSSPAGSPTLPPRTAPRRAPGSRRRGRPTRRSPRTSMPTSTRSPARACRSPGRRSTASAAGRATSRNG